MTIINENEKIAILFRMGLRETWWIYIISHQDNNWDNFKEVQRLVYHYTEINK